MNEYPLPSEKLDRLARWYWWIVAPLLFVQFAAAFFLILVVIGGVALFPAVLIAGTVAGVVVTAITATAIWLGGKE